MHMNGVWQSLCIYMCVTNMAESFAPLGYHESYSVTVGCVSGTTENSAWES